MRPQDLVCVGVFTKDDPRMLKKDVALFEEYLGGPRPEAARRRASA